MSSQLKSVIAAQIQTDGLRSMCPAVSQMMYLGQRYSPLRTVFVFSEESRLAGCSVPSALAVTELENPTAPYRRLAHCAKL